MYHTLCLSLYDGKNLYKIGQVAYIVNSYEEWRSRWRYKMVEAL